MYKVISGHVNKKSFRWLIEILLLFLVLALIIAVFVPFLPRMPSTGLDYSWAFGINQAVSQGLSFGEELIFTFGPYGSIYTKIYHPDTERMMLLAALYLAVSYFSAIVILVRRSQWHWVIAFGLVLVGVGQHSPDVVFISYPLIIALVSYKYICSKDLNNNVQSRSWFIAVILFSPFGLIPLVKGTFFVLCALVSLLCSIYFIAYKRYSLAAIALLAPVLSVCLFWFLAGQEILYLPNYFLNMLGIIDGYTQAMSLLFSSNDIYIYTFSSLLLLLLISRQTDATVISRLFLVSIYFVFLFLVFKADFVRATPGRAVLSGLSILLASTLLAFVISKAKPLLILIFIVFIPWFFMDFQAVESSLAKMKYNAKSLYYNVTLGIKYRSRHPGHFERQFKTRTESIGLESSFPLLDGTSDIYPYNQAALIASGNSWSPRPVFQSYSAYTQKFAEMNRNHLFSERAPDNIIFKVAPIDRRYPSLADGLSWPVLLNNYQPMAIVNDFLFLEKVSAERRSFTEFEHENNYGFGEAVAVPHKGLPIFIEVDIKPSLVGRLMKLLYKTEQLKINVQLTNGEEKSFRFIPAMAKSGFVISPLVENAFDFALLYGKSSYTNLKSVDSFSIVPDNDSGLMWKDSYHIKFKTISKRRVVDISDFNQFDSFQPELSKDIPVVAEFCKGYIGTINGRKLKSVELSKEDLFTIDGWMATSIKPPALPEAVFIVLTNSENHHLYLSTHRVPRPDVVRHFQKPKLKHSGFIATADISSLATGQYTLGLAIQESGKIKICPQFKVPLTVTN